MSDIVERLRSRYLYGTQTWRGMCTEAADEIERLQEELREARRVIEMNRREWWGTLSRECEDATNAFLAKSQ